jgi:hypothetical protein
MNSHQLPGSYLPCVPQITKSQRLILSVHDTVNKVSVGVGT